MKSIVDRNLKIGDTITMYDKIDYRVKNLYQLSDEYMKEHDLYNKYRITLESLKDGKTIDFARSGYNPDPDAPLF